ncbi:aromatic-ring-hydroxylating dioxygenase subunit beta [Poseidonocella sp. HB161398]|uniref:aromatic-ring-hydroxylating dioxygenase subunit beta n=1 Tax=Poseidonocella sp. HB161398 TaxID=2320855 RepID=UPI001107F4C7|nr:aromatic-ring-hydroxylating dioxygenase subunit beta [Poseidonocella sp. HB161398]
MTEMTRIESGTALAEVAAFLWAEADMLDRKDYDAWLALWDGQGSYVMPITPPGEALKPAAAYAESLNLCFDGAKMRKDRVARFQAGFSISSAPPAQTVRTVSRIVIERAEGGLVHLRAAEQLVEDKFGRQRLFAADMGYVLVSTPEGLKIRDKVVRLLNSDGMLTSISYLF